MKLKIPGIFLLLFFAACDQKPVKNTPVDSISVREPQLAQPPRINNPLSPVDVSPMDMSYYPPSYPQLKMSGVVKDLPVMRVIYSRPHLQGRLLFKEILKYGEPWRLGANEATELDVFQPVMIGKQLIKEGRYTIYCIPGEKSWVVAINSSLDTWGLKIDSTKDIVRTQVPVTQQDPPLEYFTMIFEKTDSGADLVMGWDGVRARLPITIK